MPTGRSALRCRLGQEIELLGQHGQGPVARDAGGGLERVALAGAFEEGGGLRTGDGDFGPARG